MVIIDGLESRMLYNKLRGNLPAVPEKKIFEGFLPYMGVVAILVQIGKVVSEKIQLEFLYVHNLGPRSRNDLDLQYSHAFIYSIR